VNKITKKHDLYHIYLSSFQHFWIMPKLISASTRIIELLNYNKTEVITALVKLNKNFSKLKNPILRNLLARRITIADACMIAGCTIPAFLESMQQIGFTIEAAQDSPAQSARPAAAIKTAASYLELDVRPILAQDKDPLKAILASINKLEENQGLKLVNTFEPLPLIHLLADKGFTYFVEFADDNTVITWFDKISSATTETIEFPATELSGDDEQFDSFLATITPHKIKYLDVRELEMPKPMLSILAETPKLSIGDALFIYHKKIPVYLIPELEKQGLSYLFKTLSPGNVNMLIYKP
jgi:uncharacterized protein (DUF2249 family)